MSRTHKADPCWTSNCSTVRKSIIPTHSLPLLGLKNKDQYCDQNGCIFGNKITISFYENCMFNVRPKWQKNCHLMYAQNLSVFLQKNCALRDVTFEIGSGFPPRWFSRPTRLPDYPLLFSSVIFAKVGWMNRSGFDKTSRGWLNYCRLAKKSPPNYP